jgi:LysR family transcriptional regulator for bpeEF and oprC
MSKLDQMEIFYFIATWKSFSRAALELGVSKGFVSTQINALEKDLKVKLLHRTTRHLSLTEEGELFLGSCANIVREKQLATSLLQESQAEPSGHLKITAPPSLCNTFLSELLPEFQKKYPKISLTIDASSSIKNLLQHGIDIALRITSTPDENTIARMITTFRFVVCATSSYLQKNAKLKTPNDLSKHNCLIYAADPVQNRWPFQIQNTTSTVSVQGNLISANSTIIKNALLADQGIARLPHYVLAKEITEKKLVVLFSENMKIEMPIYAIYASNITISPKIKSFISFLRENLSLR